MIDNETFERMTKLNEEFNNWYWKSQGIEAEGRQVKMDTMCLLFLAEKLKPKPIKFEGNIVPGAGQPFRVQPLALQPEFFAECYVRVGDKHVRKVCSKEQFDKGARLGELELLLHNAIHELTVAFNKDSI